jgi:hypothetical protein
VVQFIGPRAHYQIGHVVIDDLEAALNDSIGGPVQRASMVPGEIAWDACDCGLLAVSVRRMWLSDDFPEGQFAQSIVRSSPCNLPWLIGEYRIQVIRCAPNPDGAMISVPPAELDAAAEILISDAHVMINTVTSTMCELKDTDQIIDYTIGELDTQGPDGGCVGSELIVFVAIYRDN